MASPEIHARSTSSYFKFVAIYASIGGTFFGYAAFHSLLDAGSNGSLESRFDQSVVSNAFALPQFSGYFVSTRECSHPAVLL